MRAKATVLGVLLLLLCGTVMAADASLEAARRCTQVKDNLERLTCFDRALGDAAPAAPATAAAPPAAAAPAAPAAAAVAAAPAPRQAATPALVAPAPRPAATPALGDETLQRKSADRKDSGPTSLTARVAALKETRQSVYRVSLDNGQVWQQMDMDKGFFVKVGETVEIRKGSLGGYRMARVGGEGGWVRVDRLQ